MGWHRWRNPSITFRQFSRRILSEEKALNYRNVRWTKLTDASIFQWKWIFLGSNIQIALLLQHRTSSEYVFSFAVWLSMWKTYRPNKNKKTIHRNRFMHDIDFSECGKSNVSAQKKHKKRYLWVFEAHDFSPSRIAMDNAKFENYIWFCIRIRFEWTEAPAYFDIVHKHNHLIHFTEHYWLSISRLYFSNLVRVCRAQLPSGFDS